MAASDPNDETHGMASALRYPPKGMRSTARLRWTDAAGAHLSELTGRTSAGSAEGSGLVIADRAVSRLHAELDVRSDGVWVRDLGSKNGTYIDGIQIECGRVPEGGKVRFGNTELTLEAEPSQTLVDLWPRDTFGPLVGGSVAMRELFALIARIAPSEGTILIQGETGTGKELVARAIHEASSRASEPFVVIDCAALSETLLESELFGHAKGAFTGALVARAGAFETASGGTVFLDEIGELPLAMQPKLLRVLESRTVRRLGETTERRVDVRILSATHRDLRRMVNAGAFREDLFFRLAVLPLVVPPLRDRREDILGLVVHFLGGNQTIAPDLGQALLSRPWLGNVRELRNFVERAKALGIGKALAIADGIVPSAEVARTPVASPMPVEGGVSADRPYKEAREAWLESFEREYIRELLAKHQRNVASAAVAAGLNRTYLYRLIQKHGL